MLVCLELLNKTHHNLDQKAIEDKLNLSLRRLGQAGTVNVELKITDDKEMIQLNTKFRDNPSTTDVLTFENPTGQELLGSIVISADVAAIQAKQANLTLDEEITLLTNHGLLHLFGYHHDE